MLKKKLKLSALALATILAGSQLSAVIADEGDVSTKDLNTWQQVIEEVHDMEPKWGKQGVDAFKTSVDVGVPILFLDVRTQAEWEKGVLEDALLVSLSDLPKTESLKLLPEDKDAIIGIYCKGGHRSAMALVLLHQLGYDNAIVMAGGMDAWVAAEYPVVEYNKK